MADRSDPTDAPAPTQPEPQGPGPEGWLLTALAAYRANGAGVTRADADGPAGADEKTVLSVEAQSSYLIEAAAPALAPTPSPSPTPLAQDYVRLLGYPGTAGADAPKNLGRFELIGVLGKGGFGTVYLARDPRLQRCVALKVPHLEVTLSASARERFLREGRAAARLDHPAIVPVLEFEEPSPFGVIVYAYCTGPTLAQWLRAQAEPVSPRRAAALLATLADAVAHAHGRDILHRDIKPSNVILTGLSNAQDRGVAAPKPGATPEEVDLLPKLTDFGLARIASEVGDDTRSGVPFGSPSYMAPEQAAGRVRQVGAWTDVYSLGAVLYEVLTGRPPFRGDTPSETILQVLGDEPVAPRTLRRGIPRDLETIVLTCLQKQPARRYASAAALRDDLRAFLDDQPIAARPESRVSHAMRWLRRRPSLFAGLIVALLAPLMLLAGMLAWNATLRAMNAELIRIKDSAQASFLLEQQHVYGAALREAADAMAGGQPERAQQLLDALEGAPGWEHFREFTWRYVRHASQRPVTLLSEARERVTAIAISDDGRRIVTTDRDGSVRLREAETGQLQWHAPTSLTSSQVLAFAPDGSRIVLYGVGSASGTPELDLLDGPSGHLLARHPMPDTTVSALGFGRDAATIWLLIQRPGEPLSQLRMRYDPFSVAGTPAWREDGCWTALGELAVSNDARRVAFGSVPNGLLTVLDTDTGSVLWREARVEGGGECVRGALSGDGRRVAAVVSRPDGHELVTWDVESGEETARYPASAEPFTQLALSTDGAVLMGRQVSGRTLIRGAGVSWETEPIAGDPGVGVGGRSVLDPNGRTVVSNQQSIEGGVHPLELFQVATGRFRAFFPGSHKRSIDATYSASGRALAVRSGNRALYWPLDPRPDPQPAGHAREAWSAAYTPDGKLLVTGSDDVGEPLTLRIWKTDTGRQVAAWAAHPGTTAALAMHPTQSLLASAGLCDSQNLRLWKIPSGEMVADLPGNTNWLRALAFSPDGRWLATGGNERVVRLYKMPGGQLVHTLSGPKDILRALAFSPDGRHLAAGSNDGVVRVWDLNDPSREPLVAEGDIHIAALAYATDGRTIVVGDEEGGLVIRDALRLTPLRRLDSGCEELRCLALAPHGRTLAAPGEPGTLALWDRETGQRLATVAVGPAKLQGLCFAPDGTSLTICNYAGGVRLLRAPVPREGGPSPLANVEIDP